MTVRAPKLLVVDDTDRYVGLAHELLRGYSYATRCDLAGPCWSCPRRSGCDLTHAHDARELDEALARNRDVDVVLLDVAFDLPEERLLPSNDPGKSPTGEGPGMSPTGEEPDLERRKRLQGIEILAYL
ncbi:MAG: hypothetical protein HYY06_26500, partial [Deltaproteobacteria bacterium]|nr:hypothetical protein [Deltaproteobacteria bacterium]